MATLAITKVGGLARFAFPTGKNKYYNADTKPKFEYTINGLVQTVTLSAFAGTDSFKITYNGTESGLITRGTNFTVAGIKAIIEAIAGFPGTVVVSSVADTGFVVTTTINDNVVVYPFSITSPTGCTGTVASPDYVTIEIDNFKAQYNISELTVNGVLTTSASVFDTNIAVVFP